MHDLLDHPPASHDVGGLGVGVALAKVGQGIKKMINNLKKKGGTKAASGDGSGGGDVLGEVFKLLSSSKGAAATPAAAPAGGDQGLGALLSTLLSGGTMAGAGMASPLTQAALTGPMGQAFPTGPIQTQAALQHQVGPMGQPFVPHLAGQPSPFFWPGYTPARPLPKFTAAARNYYTRQRRPLVYVGSLDFDDGEYAGATDGEIDDSLQFAADLMELDQEIQRLDEEDAAEALAMLADSIAEVEVGAVARRVTSNRTRSSSRPRTGNRTTRSRKLRRRTTGNRTRSSVASRTASRRTANRTAKGVTPLALDLVDSVVRTKAKPGQLAVRDKQRAGLLARVKARRAGSGTVAKRRFGARIKRLQQSRNASRSAVRRVTTLLTQAAIAAAFGDAMNAPFIDVAEAALIPVPGKASSLPYFTAVIGAGDASADFALKTDDIEVGTLDIKGIAVKCNAGLNPAGANPVDSIKGGVLLESVTPDKEKNLLLEAVFIPFDSADGSGAYLADHIESLRYAFQLANDRNVEIKGKIVVGTHATDPIETFLTVEVMGALNES